MSAEVRSATTAVKTVHRVLSKMHVSRETLDAVKAAVRALERETKRRS